MRHRKRTCKLGRNTSHRRCLVANMVKSLIDKERVVTTVAKAKEVRRHADRCITLAKRNTLESRRRLIGTLMVRFNSLSTKEARNARKGDTSAYNADRRVIGKLFDQLGPRFASRQGGYTRIVRLGERVGDGAELCVLEYLPD